MTRPDDGGTTRYNADEASRMAWIVVDREHVGGKPRVAGTRISIDVARELEQEGAIGKLHAAAQRLRKNSRRPACVEVLRPTVFTAGDSAPASPAR